MPILDRETTLYPENLLDATAATVSGQRRWWVVYTKARQEKAFARQVLALELPFYLPLIPKTNLIRGRRMESYIPLFGGYCFLFADESERARSLTTNRVSTILTVKDQSRLVFDLRQIRQLIDTHAPLTVESRLQPGDPVRVRKGPLAGLEGTIVSRRGATRLIVSVAMLQQGVSVLIDDFLVEPL
jgi:transcriptional antiterminator RfaH